ncbi:unnamed protein product, partial [Amoebophrya sp. A25]
VDHQEPPPARPIAHVCIPLKPATPTSNTGAVVAADGENKATISQPQAQVVSASAVVLGPSSIQEDDDVELEILSKKSKARRKKRTKGTDKRAASKEKTKESATSKRGTRTGKKEKKSRRGQRQELA